ncbi:hypothetical protein ACFLZ1_02255 [Patescibacteria group bacterium]
MQKIKTVISYILLYLFLTGIFVFVLNLWSKKRQPEIYQTAPSKYEFVVFGSSTYIFQGEGRIFGNYYIRQELINRGFPYEMYFYPFTGGDYEADSYRIWGYHGEKGINQATLIQKAATFVDQANARGSQPVVVIGYGANESKDIRAGKDWASFEIFRNYLTAAVDLFKSKGAYVIINTPIKGCPTLAGKKYDVEGTLRDVSNSIVGWFSATEKVANLYAIFEAYQSVCMSLPGYSKYQTDCEADYGPCKTECLINVDSYIGPDPYFPSRLCSQDYCHPNQHGYEMLASEVVNKLEDLIPPPSPSPSPSRSPSPLPSPSQSPQASLSPSPSQSPPASLPPSPSPSSAVSPPASAEVSPSPSASVEPSASPSEDSTSFNLKIKFYSVPANDNNDNLLSEYNQRQVRIIFQDREGKYFYNGDGKITFTFNSDSKSYEGSLTVSQDILPSGSYNLLIKGPSHRQTRFCKDGQLKEDACPRSEQIYFAVGETYSLDFTGYKLEFGDVNWDGTVGVQDYSIIKTCKEENATYPDSIYENGCKDSDGNFDGVVDNSDIDVFYQTNLCNFHNHTKI